MKPAINNPVPRAVPVTHFKQLVQNQPNVYKVNQDGSISFNRHAHFDNK